MAGFLPYLRNVRKQREMIGVFGGYNHNPVIGFHEFYDMGNMGGGSYPLLAPREKRARVRTLGKPNGLFGHEKLCWVDGTDFYYDGKVVGQVSDCEKQIIAMGAYVLIWPDKAYYNAHTGEFGSLAAKIETEGTVTAKLSRLDGGEYSGEPKVSDTAPEGPKNNDLWIDTSGIPHVLRVYSEYADSWQSVPTVYVKISAKGIGKDFAQYDGVTISGFMDEALNGEFTLYGVGEDYILVTALIEKTVVQSGKVTVERKIPDMDFVTESENRVWGCSSEKREIYACALGEPKVWNRFLGVSTDSFAMSVGSPGDFTGCVTHLGYVLFFKENGIHKLYGNKPGNYQLTNTNCRGVQAGSEKSLCIVEETLFYKSPFDVCAYGAALPEAVSAALGEGQYHGAVAGALGGRYYLSMRDERERPVLFCYDTARGLWHKQDGVAAMGFASCGQELYYIDRRDGGLYSVTGVVGEYADETAQVEGDFEWFVRSGPIGLETTDGKAVSRVELRLEAAQESLVRVLVRYDGGPWAEQHRLGFTGRRTFEIPIVPRRHDSMEMMVRGCGDVKVWSMSRVFEVS